MVIYVKWSGLLKEALNNRDMLIFSHLLFSKLLPIGVMLKRPEYKFCSFGVRITLFFSTSYLFLPISYSFSSKSGSAFRWSSDVWCAFFFSLPIHVTSEHNILPVYHQDRISGNEGKLKGNTEITHTSGVNTKAIPFLTWVKLS